MEEVMLKSIGQRQIMIMQCVWESDPVTPPTVAEIADGIERKCGKSLSSATITNLCAKLIQKGYLEMGPKRSHSFTYKALMTEDEFQQQEIKRMSRTVFGGSFSRLVTTWARTDDISKEDIEIIKGILKDHEK